ncbi:unnamed protein product [Mycena citricolor]|uniref:Uncharacterized protein n=1 Tax=Mycena citricolor TaxID=2018698 RepID=A0AAD2JYA6_9AGAR|nr:unnamed protein product [Mycena citricolor]
MSATFAIHSQSRTTSATDNSSDDPSTPALRVPAKSPNSQRDDCREAHALEEQTQHEHCEALVPCLRHGRRSKRDHERDVREEHFPWPDARHERRAREPASCETTLSTGEEGRGELVGRVGARLGHVVDEVSCEGHCARRVRLMKRHCGSYQTHLVRQCSRTTQIQRRTTCTASGMVYRPRLRPREFSQLVRPCPCLPRVKRRKKSQFVSENRAKANPPVTSGITEKKNTTARQNTKIAMARYTHCTVLSELTESPVCLKNT